MAEVLYTFDAKGYQEAMIRACYDAAIEVGMRLQGEIRKELSQPGTGRHHKSWGLKYRSSAPGQPPAVQSGRLRNSWVSGSVPVVKGNTISLPVLSKLKYAAILNFGGQTGKGRRTKIAARPYLEAPTGRVRDTAEAIYQRHIDARTRQINGGQA